MHEALEENITTRSGPIRKQTDGQTDRQPMTISSTYAQHQAIKKKYGTLLKWQYTLYYVKETNLSTQKMSHQFMSCHRSFINQQK